MRRWRDWLRERSEEFSFFLRSRVPELGRCADFESFWRNVIDELSLQRAVAWLDRELVDPHAQRVVGLENEHGVSLGQATALDEIGNTRRARRKPEPAAQPVAARTGPNLVEIAHQRYHARKED